MSHLETGVAGHETRDVDIAEYGYGGLLVRGVLS